MVTVPIHQDTSSVPLMTSLIIDLIVSQLASTTVQASLPTSTVTTAITTTLPPPPPQPQQDVSNSIIIQRIETQDLSRMIKEQIVEYIEGQEIYQKIEETVKEVVTASVQYTMRALFNARFKDLPTSNIKEILLQRMLEENYDKGHKDHRMAYEALQKSILHDESEQFDANKAEERTKIKRASDTTGASDFAQDPLLPPPSLTPNPDDQSPGSATPGSSKIAGTTAYTAWTTTTSRFEPSALSIPEDVFMHEESDFAAQDMVSGDEDIGNERPATPIPAWSIPSSSLPVPIHNWASAIASSYVPPPENSLLSQTSDIGVFIDWFCKKQGITELTPEHLEVLAYEVIKACHPDVIHLQFQMEECYKLLTNQVDDRLLRYNISRPLPLGGPPGQVTIQTEFFFNRDLDYLRFGSKGDRLALSITKMKAAYYLDVGLEQMVLDHMWIEEECMYEISATYGISHCINVFSIYGYDYMKQIVLRRADNQEYTIAKNNFKDLYPSDFEDLYLLNLQGHLNHLPPRDKKILSSAVNLWIRNLVIRQWVEDFQLGIESYQTQLNLTKPRWEATGLEFMHDYKILDSPRAVVFRDKYGMLMIMRFNEIHKFSDGTLQQIDEALDYRVKEFRVNKVNPGLNTSSEESSGTWRALLVEEYEKETTDFFKEQNDDIFSLSFSTSCVEIMSRRFFLRLNLPDHRSVLMDSKVHIKMEMASTCSSRIKFIATCSYSRINDFTTSRKNDLKLPQL
ncbi:hypothetical protein Tco_1553723 [Tanacetum coccineum]